MYQDEYETKGEGFVRFAKGCQLVSIPMYFDPISCSSSCTFDSELMKYVLIFFGNHMASGLTGENESGHLGK